MDEEQIQEAMAALDAAKCSCVIRKNGVNRLFYQRGVADLYDVLHSQPDWLQGAVVADKVVGKGAAALMIAGGIAALYTHVISREALALFGDSGIAVTYNECVPFIINRAGSGRCPLETLCGKARTATECLPLVDDFVRSMRGKEEDRPVLCGGTGSFL